MCIIDINWNDKCSILREKLEEKFCIYEVSHCSIDDVDYFIVKLSYSNCRSEMLISGHLGIGRDKIRMVGYDACDHLINYISADALFDKYGSELEFGVEWKLKDVFNKYQELQPIKNRLFNKGFCMDGMFYDFNLGIFFIKCENMSDNNKKYLIDILGIKNTEIGRLHDYGNDFFFRDSGWFYIKLDE